MRLIGKLQVRMRQLAREGIEGFVRQRYADDGRRNRQADNGRLPKHSLSIPGTDVFSSNAIKPTRIDQ